MEGLWHFMQGMMNEIICMIFMFLMYLTQWQSDLGHCFNTIFEIANQFYVLLL